MSGANSPSSRAISPGETLLAPSVSGSESSTYETVEEPLWFGPADRPLFGWLARPVGNLARGGFLCAPPIGREARAGRRAIRSLALSLAGEGFVTLRFDYDGTGDSSGDFNDVGRDRAWVDSVVEATQYLRSLGLTSISAVGMRLGATLIGVAADRHDLNLSSVVLWDPCESGRSYLRELNALEALRREQFQIVAGDPIETSEFIFSPRSVEEIRTLSLSKTKASSFGTRTLVMARNDRGVPKTMRSNLSDTSVQWRTTNQQARLLDVDPLKAVLPDQAMGRILRWICESDNELQPFDVVATKKESIVAAEKGRLAVNERFVEIGTGKLFGILSEPLGDSTGPLIVMLNEANEEHTGPARLWVELARSWAGYGIRSVRFDMTGLGDSPWLPGDPEPPKYFHGWLEDAIRVAGVVSPEDPSNTVFLGLCSGAYLAIEAGLALQARGVCALNPPVSIDFLHAVDRIEGTSPPWLQKIGAQLKPLAMLDWAAATLWHLIRLFLPSKYAIDLLEKLSEDGVDLFLLYTADDLAPFRRLSFFRSMDVQRLHNSSIRRIEFVPGLDHAMHFADGRKRAVELLNHHVLERFGGVDLKKEPGQLSTEGS